MRKYIVLGLAMMCGQVVAASESPLLPNEASVVGEVNGSQITLGDIENKKIHELRSDLHKELENAFITEAIRRLRESDKEFGKISVPTLSDQDVRKFYDDNNLSMRGSYEQFAPQIRQYLTQMFTAREEYKLYKKAGDKGQASHNLVDPGPFLVSVPVETAYIQGAQKGSVMLLEFSDFQCPYCKKVQPALQQLVKKYSNKVAFGYRHFPLAFHQEADESAVAAECAREQGKFLEMHAGLYKQQKNLSVESLQELAKKIGVKDLDKFNTCLKGDKYRKLLARDMEVAQSVGISGTPAFVVGKYDSDKGIIQGEILTGALPIDQLEQAIKKYLAK